MCYIPIHLHFKKNNNNFGLFVQAGSTVPMSSLLLGDPTKAYFKLSLWREAATWVERFSAGDIVLFKSKTILFLLC